MKAPIQLVPELIRKQLQTIVQWEELKRSPLLAKFLEFVVIKKLSGKEEEIKEYSVGVFALGRPADFNPQTDACVRIHAKRLRDVLFRYYSDQGQEDIVIISIPKGSYVPDFEINPSQEPKLNHFVRENIEMHTSQAEELGFEELYSKPVVAVFPFHNLSPEHSNNDLLQSLAEQLSTQLSKFDSLNVISYYFSNRLETGIHDLKVLGDKARIDYILAGSLCLSNNTLRLNLQLMTTETGNILWSDHFQQKEVTDQNILEIQDGITGKIANIIADDHGIAGTLTRLKASSNFEKIKLVQDALTHYFDYTYNNDAEKFESTFHVIEDVCRKVGDNALIVSILAKLYFIRYAFGFPEDAALYDKAMELAIKALRLDPRCQHAQKALAFGLAISGNREESIEEITQCVSINPISSSNLRTMALGLIMLGEYENGYSMLMQSMQLNPNQSAFSKLGFALYHYHNKSYEETGRWLKRLSPFDTPFSNLLRIAVDGKTKGKSSMTDESISALKGFEQQIVDRIVHDPELRLEIQNGWEMAGLQLSSVRN